MKKNSSVARSLLLALLFIALVAGGLYWYKFMPQKNTVSIPENWKTYTDKLGFSLRYPPTVLLNGNMKGADAPVLSVDTQNISEIPEDLPMNRGRSTILADEKALAAGKFGEVFGFLVDGSQKVQPLGTTYLKTYTILAQFEVCSVMFSQNAVFYRNGYQINISLNVPQKELIAAAPEYFMRDTANCGDQMRWKEQNTFYTDLVAHKGSLLAQGWYDDFNQIVESIKIK